MAAILTKGYELKQTWRWWNISSHDVDGIVIHLWFFKISDLSMAFEYIAAEKMLFDIAYAMNIVAIWSKKQTRMRLRVNFISLTYNSQ